MLIPVLTAYLELIRFGFHIRRKNFAALHSAVRNSRLHKHTPRSTSLAELCRAVDLACIWYWKKVLCLQRSAAATCLLRRHGIAAQLVIGTQQIPFNAHAWVEVDGRVVTDKAYMPEMYAVLERI
jgi:transglutaminase superfamily protein